MPDWITGKDGEKAWDKAKSIVAKEYGASLEKSDSDRFYSLVTTVYKNVCKSPDYDCGIAGKAAEDMPVERLRLLSERMSRLVSIGNPKARKMAAYDLGAFVRNLSGELAYKLADRNDPYGELAKNFSKVKSTGKRMVKAMQDFAEAVFETEASIDVPYEVERGLGEAITAVGIRATLERAMDKIKQYAPKVMGTSYADGFRSDLEKFATELSKIAGKIHE